MQQAHFASTLISPQQAAAARHHFGWSQTTAIEKSGLQSHKLKRFEAGNYIPDASFLAKLRAFYEAHGYTFEDTPKPGEAARDAGLLFPAAVVNAQGGELPPQRPAKTTVHHMRLGLTDEREMGELLDMIELNEAQAANLLAQPIERGAFGGISQGAMTRHAQALGLLAENGVMFARLFGRHIGGQPCADVLTQSKTPSTHAELLHRIHATMHLAAAGDPAARQRKRTPPPLADSVAGAIGLS